MAAKKAKKKTTASKMKSSTSKKVGAKKPIATKTATKKKSASKKKTATKKVAAKKVTAKKAIKAKSTKSSGGSSMPQVGTTAPGFAMKSDNAGTVKLADYKGKSNVVLYFYPKDDTPGCTTEACAFQKSKKAYEKSNATLIGVSCDSLESHGKFRRKYGLDFILASDPDHSVAEKYGVWVEKNNYGKKYMGIQRATFLIDKKGKIAASWPKVKADGHDEQVQEALAQLS